jgi:glycosyltransferase involved in cell wall biosynthesis
MEITFITIAQNSEKELERCLSSTKGLGECLLVDGGSVDSTISIAKALGAQVVGQPFEYSAKQYNLGLRSVTTEWAFILDSDEALSSELRDEIRRLQEPPASVLAFSVPRRNFLRNRAILHGGWYPDRSLRLLRVGEAKYQDREVHAHVVADGETRKLSGEINHQTYRSIEHYLTKLNRFTSRELAARRNESAAKGDGAKLRGLWLKTPFKPLTRFLIMYVGRSGWRDGRLGLDIAILSGFYEYVVSVKMRYDHD